MGVCYCNMANEYSVRAPGAIEKKRHVGRIGAVLSITDQQRPGIQVNQVVDFFLSARLPAGADKHYIYYLRLLIN
jgi:hypothetical protein